MDYLQQLEHKKNDLKNKLNNDPLPIEVKTAGSARLRQRFDFTMEKTENGHVFGLYGGEVNRADQTNLELIDLSTCFQLTPDLNSAFQWLRQLSWPDFIQKGSVRLRTAPSGQWGIWLDFSNQDIKSLLLEKNFLLKLSEKFIIEIGQKKKRLDLESQHTEQLKLTDPQPEVWFSSLGQPLKCAISSFTQPASQTADLLTETILNWLNRLNSQKSLIVEYGCGIGQFTMPLLAASHSVQVFETDTFALECLKLNVKNLELKKNTSQNILMINQPIKKETIIALVNPPRSGLKDFAETLLQNKPQAIIYVSCFPETMAVDIEKLSAFYKIKDVVLVDQFPQTTHYESCVLLVKN